jgi:phosphodiesterase/alkaline phosphatase D-like protein
MAINLRTQAGPWCGGLTDTSVQIRASVLRSVATARVIVAENEALSVNPTIFPATSMWSDPERKYRHRITTFNPRGLRPTTDYFFRLEIDGDMTKALPGRFRTAPPLSTPGGFRFALSGCAKPRFLFGGVRPEAYKAIAAMKDLLFFFHLGDFHYHNIDDKSVEPRLEAYDDTLRRDGVGDLFRDMPIAYCWDDHDFLGNNSDGGDPDNAVRRRFARDAYDLYVPHYPLASTTEGIYQSFQIGRVLFLLTDSRYAKSPSGGSGTSGKTVLGVNQKAWLKGELLRGKELDLIVWASSIPWIGPDDAGEDFWAGYGPERAELAQHLVDHQIRNVCMISADAHMVAIDDGSHSGYAQGGRGGFPVFQAAALESAESEKGGPYSIGNEHGTLGPGIAGRRQFGVCEIVYGAGGSPSVRWTGFRAEEDSTVVTTLMQYEFAARQTFAGF